ncbi:MAG: hypothetical protein ACREF3_20950, partial [Acetobacteraceae bacterium]
MTPTINVPRFLIVLIWSALAGREPAVVNASVTAAVATNVQKERRPSHFCCMCVTPNEPAPAPYRLGEIRHVPTGLSRAFRTGARP